MIRFVFGYLRGFKLKFSFVMMCAVVTAASDLLMPYLSAKFIDEILTSREVGRFYFFIGGLFGLNLTSLAANWFYVIFSTKIRAGITNELIEELMRCIWRTDSRLLFKTDMVYMAKRVERDSDDLIAFVLGSIIDIAIQTVLLCMATALLLSIGAKWLILFLGVATIHALIYRGLRRRLFEASTAVRETESKYFASLSDNLLYVYGIKLHSLHEECLTTFRKYFEEFFTAGVRESKIRFWFSYGNANAAKLFTVLIFFLGGADVLDGALTVGNFVALNGYYASAMRGVSYFMTLGQGYQNAFAAWKRITAIVEAPQAANGKKIPAHITEINLRGVSYAIDGRRIVENFTQRFKRGGLYCIVGRNGAGKSTLLNLICGIIPPTGGTITFDGLPIGEVDMIRVRRNLIAVVEQRDFLKNDTASGGERRRLSIATALSKPADVLILDEPDNNLDASAVDELIKNIRRGAAYRITIIISHDARLIELADALVTLPQNKLS